MDIFQKINYTYLAIGLILLVSIVLLYRIFWRPSSQANLITPANAPVALKENFENQDFKGEIVFYYAMWCGYSRSFLPEWEKFEIYAKDNLKNVKVTKIKCEDGLEQTCGQKGVSQFPMVILYQNGKEQVIFDKERTMQKLVEFVNENI